MDFGTNVRIGFQTFSGVDIRDISDIRYCARRYERTCMLHHHSVYTMFMYNVLVEDKESLSEKVLNWYSTDAICVKQRVGTNWYRRTLCEAARWYCTVSAKHGATRPGKLQFSLRRKLESLVEFRPPGEE